MTAREKAKDIYDSYWYCLLQSDILNRHYWSKQCALIAVDELIKQEISLLGLGENYIPTWYNWVKQEIELL
jgi:hypothetical protein